MTFRNQHCNSSNMTTFKWRNKELNITGQVKFPNFINFLPE